jgi:hypothetical protein
LPGRRRSSRRRSRRPIRTLYTAAADKPAVRAFSDNYLIDLKHAVIMDVEATTAIRQVEVGAAKTMLDRTAEQFEVAASRLVADSGYGSAEMIGWLADLIASGFVNGARDLGYMRVWAALGLERAGLAAVPARERCS